MNQPISPEVLAHYGVLGMKWGVRKDNKTQGYGNPGFKGRHKERQKSRIQRQVDFGKVNKGYKKDKIALKKKDLTRSEKRAEIKKPKSVRKEGRKEASASSGERIMDRAGGSKAKAYGYSAARAVGRRVVNTIAADTANVALSVLANKAESMNTSSVPGVASAPFQVVMAGVGIANNVLNISSDVVMMKEMYDIRSHNKEQKKKAG